MKKAQEERAKELNEACLKKFIDYSNKYGLGYLLTNDSVSVHFNDNSKIVLDKNGYLIDYFEPEEKDKSQMAYFKINRIDYPPEMKKKITIL